MLEAFPIVPLGGNMSLEVAVLSYDGALNVKWFGTGVNVDLGIQRAVADELPAERDDKGFAPEIMHVGRDFAKTAHELRGSEFGGVLRRERVCVGRGHVVV